MKIAVLGAGISGLGSAYILSKKHDIDLYEKENRLGGHARTTFVQEDDKFFGVDTGFLVFNYATYPLLTKLFKELDVKIEKSDMSFAFWDIDKNIAYNGSSLKGMFAQKRNLFSFSHYQMINDIDSAFKMLYMSTQEVQIKWERTSIRNWSEIYPQLCIFFSEIMEKYTK